MEESGIPVVLVDRDAKGAQFDGVFVDKQEGSDDGVGMELIKAGHERIATITGPESRRVRTGARAIWRAMEDKRTIVPGGNVACGDFKIAKRIANARRTLGLTQAPTAIFHPTTFYLGCPKNPNGNTRLR